MKDLQIRYSHDNETLLDTFELLLKGTISGDTAIAEPSSAGIPWWASALIMALSEAYWENRLNEDLVIMGIACPEQGMIQVFTQDYRLDDPQLGMLAQAELQDTTDYVCVYILV